MTQSELNNNPEIFNLLLQEMAKTISNETNDFYLKELMTCMTQDLTPEIVLDELKRYNAGHRPIWLHKLTHVQN